MANQVENFPGNLSSTLPEELRLSFTVSTAKLAYKVLRAAGVTWGKKGDSRSRDIKLMLYNEKTFDFRLGIIEPSEDIRPHLEALTDVRNVMAAMFEDANAQHVINRERIKADQRAMKKFVRESVLYNMSFADMQTYISEINSQRRKHLEMFNYCSNRLNGQGEK